MKKNTGFSGNGFSGRGFLGSRFFGGSLLVQGLAFCLLVGALFSCSHGRHAAVDGGASGSTNAMADGSDHGGDWISLFDGKSLDGWKVGNHAETFSLQDGQIVVHGLTAHLFYVGGVKDHNFKNFELKADVMTFPGSNSGIYFHTQYQESGWPDKGFEVQVNNSHTDWKRTGSLYDVVDVREVYVKDRVWYTEYVKVVGKHVLIKINDKTVVDYTEPENAKAPEGHPGRVISSGTFALQGHDPKSEVHFKNIYVKPLPE